MKIDKAKLKKNLLYALYALIVVVVLVDLSLIIYRFVIVDLQQRSESGQEEVQIPEDSSTPSESESELVLPESYDLSVPFVAQAPFGVWDYLHDNACEEASIILTHYYKQNKALTREQADTDIKAMVDWQIKKYGTHKDLTAEESADLAKNFYGYKNTKIVYDFTWEELKKELYKGNPVIVPAAGRALGNPNFRAPGPVYHMFVIRGYTPTEIITNDVGTRKGERYPYSYATLDNAIHDWTGNPATIMQGRRVMIVLN